MTGPARKRLSAADFDAAMVICRIRDPQPARRILVDGWTLGQAADEAHIQRQKALRHAQAVLRAHEKLMEAQQLREQGRQKKEGPGV